MSNSTPPSTMYSSNLMLSVSRYWSYVRPYRAWIAGATLCGLLKFNLPLVFPWVLKKIIDDLNVNNNAVVSDLPLMMGGVFAIYGVWAVATYYRSAWADYVSHRVSFDIRVALHKHLQRLPLAWHEQYYSGALTSRLLVDVATAQNLAGAAITNTLMDASTFVLIAVILIDENPFLAAVALCSMPLYVIFVHFFQKKIRRISKLAQQQFEDTSGKITEQFTTLAFDRVYGRDAANRRAFARISRDYLRLMLKNVKNNALSLTIVGFITLAAP
ncbi:MAG: ABC transporter ATP-binding protein, partial [Pseudomonadota bacterium]